MTYHGIFVDDTEEAAQYADLLSTSDGAGVQLKYRQVARATDLVEEIFSAALDVVVLDFRLDENPEALDPRHAYLGSGLAQLLRDKAIVNPGLDFPIVLVSAEEKFERYYRADSTAHDLFDYTYGKEYAVENSELVASQILDLCESYQTIKSTFINDIDRLSIFSLTSAEKEIIDNQEIRVGIIGASAPHIVARFILRNLVDRPGILFSDEDVASRLGVASIDPVLDFLNDNGIRYEGVFGKGWRRWWSHRFNTLAEEIFGKRPVTMSGKERASILSTKLGITIEPAVSRWNGSSDEKFAVACASCSYPTEIRHSVSAFDPNAPKSSQKKRICWDCVQTDRNKIEVDELDQKIATMVKTKKRDEEI